MTPPARAQAAIEILDDIIVAARDNGAAADTLIAAWFKTRRFAGSKDRRAVRELVYQAIRAYGEPPVSGRAALLGLGDEAAGLFDGSTHAPAPVARDDAIATPGPLAPWLAALIPEAEHRPLLERAPLDLRVNRLKTTRDAVRAPLRDAEPIGRDGVRLATNTNIEATDIWRDGWVDVQDAGSQLIAQSCGARGGMLVVDLCAGAGGKALALAADMDNQGRIIATDTNRARLQNLAPRAARLGVTNIETRLLNPGREHEALSDLRDQADIVLVDAPCSGSGTWRRNPEARWRLNPQRLDAVIATQRHVLKLAAQLVKPGGVLVYAVCSLIDAEGPDQVAAFLNHHRDWTAQDVGAQFGVKHGAGWRVSPARDSCDGFFMARLAQSAE